MKRKSTICIGLILLALTAIANALPGDVDTTWQESGHLKTIPIVFTHPSVSLVDTVSNPEGGFFQVGTMRLAGSNVILLAKFINKEGLGDAGFGGGSGQSSIFVNGRSFYANEAVVQPDGKLIVVGSTMANGATDMDMLVCRVQPNGALDIEFGSSSEMPGCVFSLVGSEFSEGGLVAASSVALRPDGRIVVAGTIYPFEGKGAVAVVQLKSNGDVDATFGNMNDHPGLSIFSLADRDIAAYDVALAGDGKIIAAGRWTPAATKNTDMVVMRFSSSGKIDTGFGDPMTKGARSVAFDIGGGKSDEARKVAIGTDGSIVVGGSACVTGKECRVGIARMKSNGALDSMFGVGGRVVHSLCEACSSSPLRDLALQPDGRVIVVGSITGGTSEDIGVMRLRTNGAKDPEFSGNGRILNFLFQDFDNNSFASNDRAASVMIIDDGIFVGGSVQRDFSPDNHDLSLTRLKMN